MISSKGSVPRASLNQLRSMRRTLLAVAEAVRQDVVVEHNDRTVVELSCGRGDRPLFSVRWWTVLRQMFLSR